MAPAILACDLGGWQVISVWVKRYGRRVTHVGSGLWWGSLEGSNLSTLVTAAGRAGFSEVSATPAMYFAARAQGHTDAMLAALVAESGVTVPVIDPLLRGLPGACPAANVGRRWRSTFEYDEDDCHRAADALGSTVINLAHFLGSPTCFGALVEAIGAITERAVRRGRAIAVEAMPEGSIPDLATATAIVRAVASAGCGLTVDTWHWWRSGGDDAEIVDLASGEVFVLQLSDAPAKVRASGTEPPMRDRLLPGAGAIPLTDVLGRVRNNNPLVHVGLEVFDTSAIDRTVDERATAALGALRALEARAAALG